MNMFNCDAYRVLFPTPKLKPVIKSTSKPRKPRKPKHLVNSYRAGQDVLEALKGKPPLNALEMVAMTGVSQTGVRYIMNKLVKNGLATCVKRSDQVRKPISYWQLVEAA